MPLVLDGTNGVSGVDGTASNPAIEGTDSNTGIFYPAADTVAIGTGGTEALRVNSSQNVGIGTQSPAKQLDLAASNTGITTGDPLNTLRFTDTDTTSAAGQPMGRIEWYSADTDTAGVKAYIQAQATDGSPDADMVFATNHVSGGGTAERMRIQYDGNVGIGETSPVARLHVKTSANNATGTGRIVNTSNGSSAYSGFYIGNDASETDALVLLNSSTNTGYGGARSLLIGTNSSAPTVFITSATERARITSDGFFKAQANSTYVGSTSAYHEFITASGNQNTAKFRSNATNGQQYGIEITTANDQNDAVRSFIQCAGAATVRAEMRSNGGLANYSANNVNLASDQRLKKDISLLDTSWDKVKQIEVVNFRYKDCNEGDPLLYGVIAQQVQPIVPELVVVTQEAKEATEDTEATPEYFGIREQPMYWLAIKALQEAMTRIEALEAEVQALKGNA